MSTSREAQTKTILVPGVNDHCRVMAAAMRAYGVPAEVLPAVRRSALIDGVPGCSGRECALCIMILDELFALTRRPDFDPTQVSLFLPNAVGLCVAPNFRSFIADALRDRGFEGLTFFGPTAANNYEGLGRYANEVRVIGWHGIVAVDLLIQLQHRYRPYELRPGQSDQLYEQSVELVLTAVESGQGTRVLEAVTWSADQFARLKIDERTPRPRIGMIGLNYMIFNPETNLGVAQQIEALGGEIELSRLSRFFYYGNWRMKEQALADNHRPAYLKVTMEDSYQRHVERWLTAPVQALLVRRHPYETPDSVVKHDIGRYANHEFVGGFILSGAIELARHGCSGIVNILPFLCMAGISAAGLGSRVRADLDDLPWLDVFLDSQKITNIKTRLEALVYQAAQHQLNRGQPRHQPPAFHLALQAGQD